MIKGHSDWVLGITILAGGKLLSWSRDHTLRIWDDLTGEALVIMKGHTDSVVGVEVLSDGCLLSWSSQDVILWNDQGREQARLSRQGQDFFRATENISQFATKLGGTTTEGYSAWLKTNCMKWIEHDTQATLFWHSDANSVQKIHSVNADGCLLSNTTGFLIMSLSQAGSPHEPAVL